MYHTHRQAGSAHLLIVLVIVIAIGGALGFIFWKNMTTRTPTPQKEVSATSSVTQTPAHKTFCSSAEKLCFDYPASWQVETATTTYVDNSKSEQLTVKNAAGIPVLFADANIHGVGGTCDPNTTSTLSVIKVEKTQIAATTPTNPEDALWTVYAEQAVYFEPDNSYTPLIFLTESKNTPTVGTDPSCHPELSALFRSRTNDGFVSFGNINGMYTDLQAQQPIVKLAHYTTQRAAEAALSDENGLAQAYKVIASVRYK